MTVFFLEDAFLAFFLAAFFFFLGFSLVLWGWPMFGLIIESYGIFALFAGFLPTILMFLKKFPVLGKLLDKPAVKQLLNKIAPANLPV